MIKELGARSSKSLPYDAIEDEDKLLPEVEPLSLETIAEDDDKESQTLQFIHNSRLFHIGITNNLAVKAGKLQEHHSYTFNLQFYDCI